MDIQTSVKITWEYKKSEKDNKDSKTESNVETKEINTFKYSDGNLGDEFISFIEYHKVIVKFLSNDPLAYLEIEGCKSDEFNILKPGDEVVISTGGDTCDMLVPGYYSIKIKSDNIIYEGYYRVTTPSLEWDDLINIKETLENVVRGLSYDIYAKRCGSTSGSIQGKDVHIFELYKYIDNNWRHILLSLEQICKNPIVDVLKKYRKIGYSKNQDRKSQRWLMKHGTGNENISLSKPMYYEKHSYLTYDIKENKILKNILEEFYNTLNIIIIQYTKVCNDLNKEIEELEKEKNELQKLLNFINNSLYNADNVYKAKKDYENQIKSRIDTIKEYNYTISNISQYCFKAKTYRGLIGYFKNETFLKDISNDFKGIVISNNIVRNQNYNAIYNIYMELKHMDTNKQNRNMFPNKRTSKLFEIYSFILIKNIIEDIGFKWTKGWLKNVDNILSCSGDLLPGEMVILEKDNYKIELIFDKEYRTSNSVSESTHSQLFATGSSRRPDITVLLYKNNKFLRGLIAEIKCRKKNYIYMEEVNTNVMKQLEDYYSFKYYDGEKQQVDIKSEGITKVILIYPKQKGECKFMAGIYKFPFIQINPSKLGDKVYGYKELKEEIEKFLYDEMS